MLNLIVGGSYGYFSVNSRLNLKASLSYTWKKELEIIKDIPKSILEEKYQGKVMDNLVEKKKNAVFHFLSRINYQSSFIPFLVLL